MQPNDQEQQWRQPNAAPTGAPYAAPPAEQPQPIQAQPVPAPVEPVAPVVAPAPVQQPTPSPAPQAIPEQPTSVANGAASEPVQPMPEQAPVSPVDTVEPMAADDTPIDTLPAQPDQDTEQSDDSSDDEPLIRWQAPEYVQRDRSFVWYIVLGIVTIALTAIALLWMKTITFAILVPVMAVALVVYTRRPPNMVNYTLSKKGLYVNDKLHPYADFKAFSVLSHAGTHSFQLIPRKRFQLGQTAYFTDDMGESIVDMLAARLPMKDDKPDMYDRLSSKLKM